MYLRWCEFRTALILNLPCAMCWTLGSLRDLMSFLSTKTKWVAYIVPVLCRFLRAKWCEAYGKRWRAGSLLMSLCFVARGSGSAHSVFGHWRLKANPPVAVLTNLRTFQTQHCPQSPTNCENWSMTLVIMYGWQKLQPAGCSSLQHRREGTSWHPDPHKKGKSTTIKTYQIQLNKQHRTT